MKLRRIIFHFADVALILFFVYLIIFPQYASEPTGASLEFCGKTLIPSLFVYMILAKTVMTLPITDKAAKIIGYESIALITGLLCGAPIGAKNALSLYESGRISKRRAEYICSFTNNASVSFVVGYVGKELFGDYKTGLKLFVFQIAASVFTALIMKFVLFGKTPLPKISANIQKRIGLREAISDSATTMLSLCACAVFFIVAGSAMSHIFTLDETKDAILRSILEFSSGCAYACKTEYAVQIIAFSLGTSGISVAMQVKSVISNKLSMRPYLYGKLISGALMTTLAVIFG